MKFLSFDSEVKCSNYRQRQRSTALPITSNVFVMMYVGVYVLYVLYVCMGLYVGTIKQKPLIRMT